MKRLFILITIYLFSQAVYAQFTDPLVFASSGGEIQNQNININFTIGEVITETYSSEYYSCTNGFNQPLYIETVTEGAFFAAPNPVKDLLYIRGPQEEIPLSVKFTDINGRKTCADLTLEFISEKLPLDVSFLPDGIFLLELQQGNLHQTFKIVKLK
jgi:hypothetical protein